MIKFSVLTQKFKNQLFWINRISIAKISAKIISSQYTLRTYQKKAKKILIPISHTTKHTTYYQNHATKTDIKRRC